MKTVIFDGNNAVWRLAKRLPDLRTPAGSPIKVVYGFLRLVRSTLEDFEPDRALICWDSGKPRVRMKLWSGYKKSRLERKAHPTPEHRQEMKEVMMQMRMLRDLVGHLGVSQVSIDNVEADDLIAIACSELEGDKVIVSSDQDMMQLVSYSVEVYSPIKHELYTHKNFRKKVGLSPIQFLQMRAIIGDKSDEIGGAAKGLGETTARELIFKHGGIDVLFSSKKLRKKLEAKGSRYPLLYSEGAEERIRRNLQLMDLNLVKSETATKIIKRQASSVKPLDRAFLREYFIEKQFVSLLKDFGGWLIPFERLGA